MSMRLRGASVADLEELGIDTTGMTQGKKSIVQQFKHMAGIDIMEGTDYKSTYRILDELHEKWATLNDAERAAITEAVGGKRGGSVMSSLMTNWEDAQEVVKKAEASTGSAMREQEHYAQSIQYSIDRAKGSLQELTYDFVSSGLIKGFFDFGNEVLNILDAIVDRGQALPGIIGTLAGVISTVKGVGIFDNQGFNSNNIFGQMFTVQKGTIQEVFEEVSFAEAETSIKAFNDGLKASGQTVSEYLQSTGQLNTSLGQFVQTTVDAGRSAANYVAYVRQERAAQLANNAAVEQGTLAYKAMATAKQLASGLLNAGQCLKKGLCDWVITNDGRFVNNIAELKSKHR